MQKFISSSFVILLVSLVCIHSSAQTIQYNKLPARLKFFARDNQDSSAVAVSGVISSQGYDSVYVKLYKSLGVSTQMIKLISSGMLTYSGGSSSFSLLPKIHAELAEYKMEVYAAPQGTPPASHVLLQTVDSLVCGDAFLIAGQSNAHPANTLATYQNEFCRTLGVQTGNLNYDAYSAADTLWGYANGHGFGGYFSGPYLTGVWGIRLMQYIKDSFNIPVCIINGAAGSSSLEENLPSNTHQDLTSIYGKLLYRVQKAGLSGSIRAIFWYQGEGDDWRLDSIVYPARFNTLYNAWKTDYTPVSKIYVMQIHHGCGDLPDTYGEMRDYQRTLRNRYPDIETMSTMNLPGHDGCHFSKEGYDTLSYRLFRLVARDFYGSPVTDDIYAPDIAHVYYTDRFQKNIRLLFTNTSRLSVTSNRGYNLKDYFYIDSISGHVSQMNIQENIVTLTLSQPLNAGTLTYLPERFYNNTSDVYEGPYLVNSRNIGAFTFYKKAIENNTPYTAPLADFGYDTTQLLMSASIHLTDSSTEWPSFYSWTAPGGMLSLASAANPTVTYNSPGTYPVTLTVANAYGSSSVTRTITVRSSQVLPLTLVNFNASESNCSAVIEWTTSGEYNIGSFAIEQSADGINYNQVASSMAKGQVTNSYKIIAAALPGNQFYRLKIIGSDNTYSYSKAEKLTILCQGGKEYISVYPNPVSNRSYTTVQYKANTDKSNVTLTLADAAGTAIWQTGVQVKSGMNTYKIPLLPLAHGLYFVYLKGKGWKTEARKITVAD